MFFQKVEGEAAVLNERGVFKQVDIYTRNGQLFAKNGAGFVRLMVDGSTTKARCRLDTLSWDGPLFRDALGRLYGAQVDAKIKPLAPPDNMRLLGLPAPGDPDAGHT